VVVLSADATPSQIERLLAAGARNYLTKPFDIDPFLTVVDEMVGECAAA
jgi:CheY-like chemotaxis protein